MYLFLLSYSFDRNRTEFDVGNGRIKGITLWYAAVKVAEVCAAG